MDKVVVAIALFVTSLIFAQNKDENLFEGTQSFENKNYVSAEADFRVSQSNNDEQKAVADYNLGNSIYRQNQPGEAKYKFLNTIETAKTKAEKHKAYHNLGNVFMKEENYQAAVEAYKNALRNNPLDEETRYNYALAKEKLKNEPPKQNKKDKDQDKDKDKKDQDDKNKDKDDKEDQKDKKDSDKGDKEDKNKKDEDKQDKNDGDKKEDPNANPKPSGANKQQIENLLDAVNNAEKKIQDKLNAKKVKVQHATNGKDW